MEIVFISLVILALVIALWLGGWQWIGSKFVKLLPYAPLQEGDKAAIYLNGRYNRTATLSKVVSDAVYIYDNKVRLPLDYRGRFYGIGLDVNDGSRLAYLPKRGYYRLIRVAELLRKLFALDEDESNLNPNYESDEQIMTETAGEGQEEDEK